MKGHDCIVCPYHGWAFDKEGTLKDVPAAEHDDEWPKMPILEGYPVEEKVLIHLYDSLRHTQIRLLRSSIITCSA